MTGGDSRLLKSIHLTSVYGRLGSELEVHLEGEASVHSRAWVSTPRRRWSAFRLRESASARRSSRMPLWRSAFDAVTSISRWR